MRKFIEDLASIWKIKELGNRIVLTLGILLVYRLGAHIILPGIDSTRLHELADRTSGGGLLDILNALADKTFSNTSVFALEVTPYISVSIVVQLMGIAIPYLQKLQKESESGRRKINQITRWLTTATCIVQAPIHLYGISRLGVPDSAFLLGKGLNFIIPAVTILITGTIFAMWLGEKITDKGTDNGISLLIMVDVTARLSQAFASEVASRLTTSNGGLILILIEIILRFVIILLCMFLIRAVRQIPVQYARRTADGGSAAVEKSIFGVCQYIPLKPNAARVMPIIFTQALMFIPATVAGLSQSEFAKSVQAAFSGIFEFWYNPLFATMIILFTYFYTAITVSTNKMADDLKRSGGFIPEIRPGEEIGDYLDRIMSPITLPGSIYIALAVIFLSLLKIIGMQDKRALFYGGTSLPILVGIATDTIRQVNSHPLNRHYDGSMKTGKNRKVVS